jgi:hypothetical protein
MPPSKAKCAVKPVEVKLEPMLKELRFLGNELKQELKKSSGSQNPRDVILKYIQALDDKTISYYFSFLVGNDVRVQVNGNLKLTSAREISTIYLRSYFWSHLRLDKDLKRRYETTIYANSFV